MEIVREYGNGQKQKLINKTTISETVFNERLATTIVRFKENLLDEKRFNEYLDKVMTAMVLQNKTDAEIDERMDELKLARLERIKVEMPQVEMKAKTWLLERHNVLKDNDFNNFKEETNERILNWKKKMEEASDNSIVQESAKQLDEMEY